MATSANPASLAWGWRELYLTALMEADKGKMPVRIALAERIILERAKELFRASGDNIEEEEAVDDALYALRALKICLEINGGFAEPETAQPHAATNTVHETQHRSFARPA